MCGGGSMPFGLSMDEIKTGKINKSTPHVEPVKTKTTEVKEEHKQFQKKQQQPNPNKK
jgi:hypothetical protein